MTGCIWTSTYCFFVVFIVVSFFSLTNPPDEGLSLRSYPPFQGWCAPAQFVKPVHQQRKRFLSCMPAAVDELHGGDVGLAAKAAATRGSRPYGLSPPLRGDRGPHGLFPHTLHNYDETHFFVGVPCRRACAAGRYGLIPQQGREHPAQPRCFTCNGEAFCWSGHLVWAWFLQKQNRQW